MMNEKKRVLILATGGTIASKATDKGFVPGISGQELIDLVPGINEVCYTKVRQIMNVDSSDMQVSDWYSIASACRRGIEEDFHGIVITHGTDTLCYTAAALSFLLPDLRIPIILTGAQRPVTVLDSDGPGNVIDACRVAVSNLKGVFIVFNHKIINGSRAFKMYAKDFDAYVSRNYPYVGFVDEDVVIARQPKILSRADSASFFPGLSCPSETPLELCDDISLVKVTPATKPNVFDHIVLAGYAGVVIEGFGTGGISNLNRGMLERINYIIHHLNIPIVMISQCPYDGVNLAVYGVGEKAREAGIISGNDMTTETAVVKLMWVLAQTKDLALVDQMMNFNFCDEVSLS